MKKQFTTVEKFVRQLSQTRDAIVVTIAMGISISLFANDGVVAAMPSLQYDMKHQFIELVENTHSISPTDYGEVCFFLNSNEENTSDKLLASFRKLKIDETEVVVYEKTFERMLKHISSLPFQKTSADIDQISKTLELMGVLPSGILMTLAKPYSTLSDNFALLTIVYKREVIMSTLVDMADLASRMLSIESKLHE